MFLTPRSLAFITALVVCVFVPAAEAQDQTVVFIHGLNSSGSTWDTAVPYVQDKLAVTGLQPTQSWWRTYEDQANELHSRPDTFFTPPSTIAFGHSNGGIVAREWSKQHSLGGIVTLGTPHWGAPIVNHIFDWLHFNSVGTWYDSGLVSSFATPHNLHLSWVLDALAGDALAWTRWFRGFVSWQALINAGLDLSLPVINQMTTPSAYTQQLNSVPNLMREAAVVPRRVGIVDVPTNFFFGGPARLVVAPEHADQVALALHIAATTLYVYGAYVQASADPYDPFGNLDAHDKSNWMMTVGQWLNSIDIVWCSLVSSPGPISWANCQPNDSLVPWGSQAYPGAEQVLLDGVAHTFETRYSNEAIVNVLHTMLGVPERQLVPPPPPAEPPPADPPPPSSGPPPHSHGYDVLDPGEHLYPDQARQSSDGRFTLLYQSDGNLVIYLPNGEPIWSTGTMTVPGQALMTGDGNFIVLDVDGNCVWATNTGGNDGAYLVMQNDGNLVVYSAWGDPLWASNTAWW